MYFNTKSYLKSNRNHTAKQMIVLQSFLVQELITTCPTRSFASHKKLCLDLWHGKGRSVRCQSFIGWRL